jgi:hypothetical protein
VVKCIFDPNTVKIILGLSFILIIWNIIPYVEASTESPYQSGHDHGCDDAKISDKSERYIEQPEKGPDFHTDEFMAGYYDGVSECGGEIIDEERGEDIDRDIPVDVLLRHSNTGIVNVCVYTIDDEGGRHGSCEEIALYGEGYESPYLVEGNTVNLKDGTTFQACASLPSGEDEKCTIEMIIGPDKQTVELEYYIEASPSSTTVSEGSTLSVAFEDEDSICYYSPTGGPHICSDKNLESKSTTSTNPSGSTPDTSKNPSVSEDKDFPGSVPGTGLDAVSGQKVPTGDAKAAAIDAALAEIEKNPYAKVAEMTVKGEYEGIAKDAALAYAGMDQFASAAEKAANGDYEGAAKDAALAYAGMDKYASTLQKVADADYQQAAIDAALASTGAAHYASAAEKAANGDYEGAAKDAALASTGIDQFASAAEKAANGDYEGAAKDAAKDAALAYAGVSEYVSAAQKAANGDYEQAAIDAALAYTGADHYSSAAEKAANGDYEGAAKDAALAYAGASEYSSAAQKAANGDYEGAAIDAALAYTGTVHYASAVQKAANNDYEGAAIDAALAYTGTGQYANALQKVANGDVKGAAIDASAAYIGMYAGAAMGAAIGCPPCGAIIGGFVAGEAAKAFNDPQGVWDHWKEEAANQAKKFGDLTEKPSSSSELCKGANWVCNNTGKIGDVTKKPSDNSVVGKIGDVTKKPSDNSVVCHIGFC